MFFMLYNEDKLLKQVGMLFTVGAGRGSILGNCVINVQDGMLMREGMFLWIESMVEEVKGSLG